MNEGIRQKLSTPMAELPLFLCDVAEAVNDGLKTNETCRFVNRVFQKPVGPFIPPGPGRCQSRSRSDLLGVERSWHPFEEGRSAGAQSGRKRPQEHGKTVVFKPATFYGFRNDAETPVGTDLRAVRVCSGPPLWWSVSAAVRLCRRGAFGEIAGLGGVWVMGLVENRPEEIGPE